MSNKITIVNSQKKFDVTPQLRQLLRKTCSCVLKLEELEGDYDVCITFTDNENIRDINSRFRNIDRETDVLSFPLGENGIYDINPETGHFSLGDIIISLEKAAKQADSFGHSFEREASYLTAHSMLHLLGYDHMNDEDKKIMRQKEKAVMKYMKLDIETEKA